MKNKSIVISTILIVLLISSVSYAWFTSNTDILNKFEMGTVNVEVLEPGFEDFEGAEELVTYSKNVKVRSLGSKKTYVRVRLVPYWSDQSLPVSNVRFNLASNSDWEYEDGYYYFKYYLEKGDITSLLLNSIEFTELGPEYEGKRFSLKVVAEGVQISNDGWKKVWNLSSLPFTLEQPWNE